MYEGLSFGIFDESSEGERVEDEKESTSSSVAISID